MASDPVITAAEFATHVECPRRYEFEHVRSLSPRREHESRTRAVRRALLAEAVVAGLTADCDGPVERAAVATESVGGRWSASPVPVTAARKAFDTAVLEAALDAYFRGVGERHADGLLDTDTVLSSTLDGITYEVCVDALVRHDGTTRALVVVPDLVGVHPTWIEHSRKRIIEPYRSGDAFYPRQVGHLVRAELAIRGLRAEFGFDADVDFAYLSPLGDVEPDYGSGDGPTVTPEIHGFGGVCADERSDVRKLLEARGPRIVADGTRVSNAERERVRGRWCGECPYRDACPDRIESRVSFADRRPKETDADPGFSPVEPRVREDR